MGDLSKNFSRREFVCHCCGGGSPQRLLVQGLQELRDLAGTPILVISGYRCFRHNRKVGGVTSSQHLLGTAADIRVPGLGVGELYALAEQVKEFQEGGIGVYPEQGFVHVDVRRQEARWGQVKGRYCSIEEALAEA